ncbi:MAG: hypothetical protein F4Y28_08765 [Acidimicrobiia bacterium]|nr:hypothetical protein [Acidimicrobiia bacterium]MYG57464.1 hypothetical protein [Acidimicrobiia bacterium]MYJ31341.1 hypothetical protein [Acidimicrobiia bacterium]
MKSVAAVLVALIVLLGLSPVQAHDPSSDIAARDRLIQEQEALLNVYRCMFDIDTQLVPGGCVDGKPSLATPQNPSTLPTQTAQPVEIVRCYEVASGLLTEAVAEVRVTNAGASARTYGYMEVGFFNSADQRVDWGNDLQNVRLAAGQSLTVFVDSYVDAAWSTCRVTEFRWR